MNPARSALRRTVNDASGVGRLENEVLDACLLEDVDGARRPEADHVRQTHRGAFDLAIAGLAPEVERHFDEIGNPGAAEGMTLGDQPTGDIDGNLAVTPRTT